MNIFDAIKKHHNKHPECCYTPTKKGSHTQFAPGTPEKIDEMVRRIERGEPLFDKDDKADYDGCPPGCVRGSSELTLDERSSKPIIQFSLPRKDVRCWWEE